MADPTGPSLDGAGAGVADVDVCSLEIERNYEIIPAVICSMCCLFGIIYCFFGKNRRSWRHMVSPAISALQCSTTPSALS
ncbi:hypothetical protein NHX12_031145 [Muraenolepis orangiensis]|uniref:Uncharacterized protein n=1 Tax=Muraenolepis orangiensis TaxID=630683 RepID=A0A9Q0IMI0_9TELE|nr:hypothetical protein NHX12_031145 [Muraenolepis orangiensis]